MDNNNKNLKNSTTITLFNSEKILGEKDRKSDAIKVLLDKYFIRDMNEWKNVNADLIITDPPFGIKFSGKNGNYHRNVNNVVDGYVEWTVAEYGEKIHQLLEIIKRNLKENGQALIFSGWNNKSKIYG